MDWYKDLSTAARRLVASLAWAPNWTVSLVVLVAAWLTATAAHSALFAVLTRFVTNRGQFLRSLVLKSKRPTRLATILISISIAAGIAPLTERQADLIQHFVLVGFITLFGWLSVTALNLWTNVYLRGFKLDADDNMLARSHVTQTQILQRVAVILIVVVTTAAGLMTFDSVRQYGVSLLASAGAAGLVFGLALQPLLKNLVAGIQLAITQPIRLEDSVIVNGEWGNVEEITATYVVLRLWDWRRMVVPLTYFMENPFQNWTRNDSSLIGTVLLYADYTAPVDLMRRKLEEIAKESKLWDGRIVNMQVTDFHDYTMEIRMLVSAANAPRVFDLRCEVREKMIAWLQAEHHHALPRRRAEFDSAAAPVVEHLRPNGDGARVTKST